MADLPNINIANVGIIAFWNAEDHKTAGIVDPTDCTGVFDSYDVYDNGLDGHISLGSGRNFNCRVKNDGWCVAWIDRTNTFGYPNKPLSDFGESGYKGYYDILWDWTDADVGISSTLTTLSYILSLFEAALETSGDFTFSAADVGHYCYEYPNANVLSLINIYTYNVDQSGDVQYTSGTTLYHASIAVRTVPNTIVTFAGNSLMTTFYLASADLISENWIPDPLTNYTLYCQGVSNRKSNASIIIIWS